MSNLPTVRKVRTREQIEAIQRGAAADNHYVIAPTHYVEKNGQIAGYWSINGIPNFHLWHDSKLITARDSIHLTDIGDAIISNMGFSECVMYCAKSSPYYNYMHKLGFQGGFNTNLFVREIK